MTRLAIVFVLLLSLTGCLATYPSKPASNQSADFKSGLENLEQNGDTSGLKSLAADVGQSAWSDYSRSILDIYTAQKKKIQSLQSKNKKLQRKSKDLASQNRKLQSNLNKLNQLNLELEKRVN